MDPLQTGKLVLFQVSYHNNWYWFEMIPFILLGCMGGLLGAFFIKMNIKMCALRKRSRLSEFPITETAVVAAVTLLASYGSEFMRCVFLCTVIFVFVCFVLLLFLLSFVFVFVSLTLLSQCGFGSLIGKLFSNAMAPRPTRWAVHVCTPFYKAII